MPRPPSLFPTRRRFLGMGAAAGAALAPLGCATPPRPGATPLPRAADVPAARKAGVASPDVEALLAQMTLDEKIGQMTQADMKALKDGKEVHDFLLGLGAVGRATRCPSPTMPDTLGGNVRPLPGPGAVDAARDPDPLRRRRGPRSRRGQGRDDLPAQHRHGLHAQSGARRGGGARDRARGGGHRPRLDLRALHRGRRATSAGAGPTRATARRRSWPRAWAPPPSAASSRRPDGSGDPGRPPSTSWATAAPPAARTRATRSSPRRICAASTCPATSRR